MKKLQTGSAIVVVLLIIVLVTLVGVGTYIYLNPDANNPFIKFTQSVAKSVGFNLPNSQVGSEQKTRHFVDSSPFHGETFASFPYNVVVNFNTEIFETSSIKLQKNGQDVQTDPFTLDDSKKALRLKLPNTLDSGTYTVVYKECSSDGLCESGNYSFVIDQTKKDSYKDMTDNSDVTISMQRLAFTPEKVIIKKGTKVTWVNEEATNHEVNTDPQISLNSYDQLNSTSLAANEKFTYQFFETGEFPYHCSFHYPQMTGSIIVVE